MEMNKQMIIHSEISSYLPTLITSPSTRSFNYTRHSISFTISSYLHHQYQMYSLFYAANILTFYLGVIEQLLLSHNCGEYFFSLLSSNTVRALSVTNARVSKLICTYVSSLIFLFFDSIIVPTVL